MDMSGKKKPTTPAKKRNGKTYHYDGLIIRHQQFVREYLTNGFYRTAAYKVVYPEANEETARKAASALTTRSDIKAAIKERGKMFETKTNEGMQTIVGDINEQMHTLLEVPNKDDNPYVEFRRAELYLKFLTKKAQLLGLADMNKTPQLPDINIIVGEVKDAAKDAATTFDIDSIDVTEMDVDVAEFNEAQEALDQHQEEPQEPQQDANEDS
jgi:hypothetical protein